MQSDHRSIQLALPIPVGRKKKKWKPPRKHDIQDPHLFGEAVKTDLLNKQPQDLLQMEQTFAETAAAMGKKKRHDPISRRTQRSKNS